MKSMAVPCIPQVTAAVFSGSSRITERQPAGEAWDTRSLRGRNDRSEKVENRGQIFTI